ncbi:hypothetical protein EVAR_26061_1 [Eumeta japonica]|uniref:Uncharacterized protein n=1 Tax=Eumeta variegata TaxID=151549 RepID=A0A4C1VR30_EUMVA|nr:hypothetical protein EVAR_26061_1 [Eumeta japonica]
MPVCPKKGAHRKGHAAPSACARGPNYTNLRPSSNGSSQCPPYHKAKSVVHRRRFERGQVDNFDYRHQRARDSREKISRRRGFERKTDFLSRTRLTRGGDQK